MRRLHMALNDQAQLSTLYSVPQIELGIYFIPVGQLFKRVA